MLKSVMFGHRLLAPSSGRNIAISQITQKFSLLGSKIAFVINICIYVTVFKVNHCNLYAFVCPYFVRDVEFGLEGIMMWTNADNDKYVCL